MKRKIIIFALLSVLVAFVVFVSSNQEYSDAMSVREYNRLGKKTKQEVEVIGKIKSISFETFTIVDLEFPEDKLVYTFEKEKISLKSYSLGDTVLVKSHDKKDDTDIEATNIMKMNINRALKHLRNRKPLLKPSKAENTSEGMLKIKLENVGKNTVNYKDLYDENFGYSLVYKLNNKTYPFQPVEDFGTIAPGEIMKVNFPIDINMISEMEKGENIVTFIWGQKSLYDEDFKTILESEPIEIILGEKST